MPTLLQINATANWGSTGKIVEQIGLLAQKYGWDSYVAYGRYMNPSKNKLVRIGNILDVYEHYFESKLFNNEGLASRRSTKMFLKEIDKIRPDIVHLHNIHDHYLNYELLFCYLAERKIPVVWTQHDLWSITGNCCYIPETCNRWKNECFNCPILKWFSFDFSSRNHQLKKKLISNMPSLFIVPVSNWLGNIIHQSHLTVNPINVIHNGVDLEVFKSYGELFQYCYGIPSHKKVILGVASPWSERKGFKDFIELSKLLDERFVIVLVGLNREQLNKLPNNMIGLKRTQNQTELARLYARAEILLSLSYGETFGMTMAEAYACGTPCIVYDNTAQSEIVTPVTGRIAKTGNVNDVMRIVYAMVDENFKKNHSEDCRKRAELLYDKNKCFEEYIDLYDKLLKGNKNSK